MKSSQKVKTSSQKVLRISISVIFFLCFTQVYSQKIVTTYYNAFWMLTAKDFANYYRIGMIDTIKYKYYGVVRDYYKNGNLQMIGRYQENMKQDTFLFYYPSGKLETIGFYKDNTRWGIWNNYYENGKLKDKIVFNKEFLSVLEYYDEAGNPRIQKGTGVWETQYFNDSGISIVFINGSFKDSLRNGTWTYYTKYLLRDSKSDDRRPVTEVYEKGKFKSGKYYRSDGKIQDMKFSTIHVLPETTKFENTENWKTTIYASRDEYPFLHFLPGVDSSYFPVNRLAYFPGGTDSLKNQIVKQIKLSKFYIRSQQHRLCMFKIMINENGDLEIEEDPNISMLYLMPDNKIFYEKVIKSIKSLPNWIPALRNNKAVRSHFNLSVTLDKGSIKIFLSNINQIIPDQGLQLIS
jgi:antitoxin component YwqK of YwqJK toxin-antitoxin module